MDQGVIVDIKGKRLPTMLGHVGLCAVLRRPKIFQAILEMLGLKHLETF